MSQTTKEALYASGARAVQEYFNDSLVPSPASSCISAVAAAVAATLTPVVTPTYAGPPGASLMSKDDDWYF